MLADDVSQYVLFIYYYFYLILSFSSLQIKHLPELVRTSTRIPTFAGANTTPRENGYATCS